MRIIGSGVAALLPLVAISCTGAAPSSASPSTTSPSPVATINSPTPGSELALLVSFPHGNAQGNTGYDLTLVATTGKTVASTHASARTFIGGNPSDVIVLPLPEVTASKTRAYYLDGDTDVRYLRADGSTGLATHVPGTATAYAAFAVSPDDRRIAVAVFDFSKQPPTVRLYVEDMDGSHHADIFSSSTEYVWPVGWHAGQLVLAASNSPSAVAGNPYGAPTYHVVDPANATRLATIGGYLGSRCAPVGPLSAAGTACYEQPPGSSAFFATLDWSGREGSLRLAVASGQESGALSADGSQLAGCCDNNGNVSILSSGGVSPSKLPGQDGVCWLDSGHLYNGPELPATGTAQVLDVRKNVSDAGTALTPIAATGYCAGVLPQDFG